MSSVAVGGVVVTLLRRPGDVGLTAITTVVLLGVVSMAPHEQAWAQPLLRLLDKVFGALIGFGMATLWSAARRALAGRARDARDVQRSRALLRRPEHGRSARIREKTKGRTPWAR